MKKIRTLFALVLLSGLTELGSLDPADASPLGTAAAVVEPQTKTFVTQINSRRNRNIAIGVAAGVAAAAIIAGTANAGKKKKYRSKANASNSNYKKKSKKKNAGSNSCSSLRYLCETSNPNHARCYDYDYRCLGYGG